MQSFEIPEKPLIQQHRPQDLRKYSIVPIRAANDRRIRPAAMRVLLTVCSYANRAGLCWPSHENVGKALGVSRQAAGRQIRKLRDMGYLKVVKNHSHGKTAQILRVIYDETLSNNALMDSVKFEDLPPTLQAWQERKTTELLNQGNETVHIVAVTAMEDSGDELVGRVCVQEWVRACRSAGFDRLALPEDFAVCDKLAALGVLRSAFDAELGLLLTSIQGTQREPPHRFTYFLRLANDANLTRRVCSPPPLP
jgi:biotin operon repressor